jgi:glutamate decarboxylase
MADQTVQRIVVRKGMNRSLARALIDDIKTEVDFLDSLDAPIPHAKDISAFAH